VVQHVKFNRHKCLQSPAAPHVPATLKQLHELQVSRRGSSPPTSRAVN
jgi:hypothetical protein